MSDWIIPWIDFLRWEFVRLRAYEPGNEYRWIKNDTSPLIKMTKPLNKCRVSFWCQCAARLKDQEPWEVEIKDEFLDDCTWREIPRETDIKEMIYVGGSMGYDAEQDRNLVFPLDRFRELEEEGFIGELAPVAFSSHPTFRVTALKNKMAPKLIDRVKDLGIDAMVFLVM